MRLFGDSDWSIKHCPDFGALLGSIRLSGAYPIIIGTTSRLSPPAFAIDTITRITCSTRAPSDSMITLGSAPFLWHMNTVISRYSLDAFPFNTYIYIVRHPKSSDDLKTQLTPNELFSDKN